ncbi:LysR family transcriptional regulator [Nocardia sp. NPDC048505]|uniref:LysR family transcriptional regulator n=1 Tax=unclassified Nocardia TaxID=2637762 RepID=UPI0033CF0E6F
MLERSELEAFLILAEELHFGRTADRMRVSTGRVSQIIRRLERRVGGRLFDRSSRCVDLTPIGRDLHARVLPAVQQIRTALREAREQAAN